MIYTLMIITFICIVLIIYHHLGYPILLRIISKWLTARRPKLIDDKKAHLLKKHPSIPSIVMLIPAYNEAEFIAEKIRNLAILDYPKDRFRAIIACDGCSDNTAEIARKAIKEWECCDTKITVIEHVKNRGKVAIINKVMSTLDDDLVALSDVSALISIDALQIARARFSDENVGLVTGHYQLFVPGSTGEATYWQYQSEVKQQEAALGSVIGAHGAFYIIRRSLFIPLPNNSINDDFIIAMSVVKQGYQAQYASSINALELEQASSDMDYQRRSRIAAGNLQQLILFKGLMSPKYKGVAFTFGSGKGLRVLMPILMIEAWLGSLLLVDSNIFFLLAAASQSLIYLLALLFQLIHPPKEYRLWQTIHYVVSGYLANLFGCIHYLRGHYSKHWHSVNH